MNVQWQNLHLCFMYVHLCVYVNQLGRFTGEWERDRDWDWNLLLPWYQWVIISRTPPRHQNPPMLKSLIYSDIMFAYNQSTTGMYYISIYSCMGFPGGLVGKESACSARDAGRLRFSPLVGKIHWSRACNPLLYSCLENPMDRGAW